jgi:glucose uptake protein GlcU
MNLQKIRLRNVFAGIILGIPNYFSIYYLLRMLNSRFLPSAALIPICNISILVGSVLVGRFIFKETLSKKNIYGIALGCIVILLLTII